MPLRGGARDALARDDAGTHCCIDCEQADLLIQVSGGLDFGMARIAVANARQEHLRLPSLPPAYGLGVPLKDSTRTLDEHHAWLDVAVPHWSELGWPDDE